MPGPEYSEAPERQFTSQQPSSQPTPALRDALARLEQAVSEIHDSDAFRAYLDVQARFHRYSFSNALLILAQRPTATSVAGYQTWRSLGRQVRRGEHGMKIFVPVRVRDRRPETDTASGHDEQDEREPEPDPTPTAGPAAQIQRSPASAPGLRLRFGVGTVYDISQTDGKPLPTIDVPVLEGDDGEALYAHLAAVAGDEDLTIQHGSDRLGPATLGFYSPTERLIVLRAASNRQMTKTLAHELAHHFGGASASSPEEETLAESVAYVVCARFGLDTGERSFPYVATWSQDQRVFRAALGRIQQISHHLIERVERRESNRLAERSHELG